MSRSLFALAVVASALPAFAQEVQRKDLKPGLLFTAADKAGFGVTRLESSVGLTLNPGDAAHPRSDGGQTLTWTGYIQIVAAGKYKFDATLLGKLEREQSADQVVLIGEVKGQGRAAGRQRGGTEGRHPDRSPSPWSGPTPACNST